MNVLSGHPVAWHEYYVLRELFARAPGINADVGVAKNLDWEVLGTNAVSTCVTHSAKGGVTLTTAGAATDSVILLPHLDAAQSAWSGTTWLPSKEPMLLATIATPAALTNHTFWIGFKLTNTPVVATDNDQVLFRYQNGTDTTWRCINSIAGTDDDDDSGVTVAGMTSVSSWSRVPGRRRG